MLFAALVAAAAAAAAGAHGGGGGGFAPLSVRSGGIGVSVQPASGNYSVSVDGILWLASAAPDHLGRPLAVLDVAKSSGSDKHGPFDAVTVRWRLASAGNLADDSAVLHTELKAYTGGGGGAGEMLALTQHWPAGVANTSAFFNSSTDQNLALGRFPAFRVGNASAASPQLNWFAFNGCQIQFSGFGRWAPAGPGRFSAGGAQESMPLVLYDRAQRSIGLSPSSHFFNAVHETASSGGAVFAAGPMASVWSLPPGFNYTTLLVGGKSINRTMTHLGAALLLESGKTPVNPLNESFVLSHLGYWVDNGAPYYHTTAAYNLSLGMEACSARGNCTQEDALKAVQADAFAREIPIRYMRACPPPPPPPPPPPLLPLPLLLFLFVWGL